MTQESPTPPSPPPETQSHGQRPATEADSRALIASAPTAEYLGKDLPASLSGLAVADEQLSFNRAGVAALNASMGLLIDGRDRALKASNEERERCRQLEDNLRAAEQRAAIAETRLDTLKANAGIPVVASGIGFALLGLVPFTVDKTGWLGGLVAGLLGTVLIGSVFLGSLGWRSRT